MQMFKAFIVARPSFCAAGNHPTFIHSSQLDIVEFEEDMIVRCRSWKANGFLCRKPDGTRQKSILETASEYEERSWRKKTTQVTKKDSICSSIEGEIQIAFWCWE